MSSNSLPGAPRGVGRQGRTPGMCASVRGGAERCRLDVLGDDEDARLFTGPRGGRISTAVLRDATQWDEVVMALGHGHLRRHDCGIPD